MHSQERHIIFTPGLILRVRRGCSWLRRWSWLSSEMVLFRRHCLHLHKGSFSSPLLTSMSPARTRCMRSMSQALALSHRLSRLFFSPSQHACSSSSSALYLAHSSCFQRIALLTSFPSIPVPPGAYSRRITASMPPSGNFSYCFPPSSHSLLAALAWALQALGLGTSGYPSWPLSFFAWDSRTQQLPWSMNYNPRLGRQLVEAC
jgi:hypothetical protein